MDTAEVTGQRGHTGASPAARGRIIRGDWQKTEHWPGPVTRREAQWPAVAGQPDARDPGEVGRASHQEPQDTAEWFRLCPGA